MMQTSYSELSDMHDELSDMHKKVLRVSLPATPSPPSCYLRRSSLGLLYQNASWESFLEILCHFVMNVKS